MSRVFDSGTVQTLNLEAKNPTDYTWQYRFVILLGGVVVDELIATIDPRGTKLLSTDILMPEISEPTELTFQVHAYEISGTTDYDLGIKASSTVIVQNVASDNAYNASAYFDGQNQASYVFEAGTTHKVTVKFTNPYDTMLEFYIAGRLGAFDAFNTWGFFSLGPGQTVIKEADFLTSNTPAVVGPVTFPVHCTTSGITGVDIVTGSVEIIESQTLQDGTIEMIPVQTSVGQGRPFEFDVKITNPTNKVWTYSYTALLTDVNGQSIGGISTTMGVAPYSSETKRFRISVIYGNMIYPPVGAAYLKTNFMGSWQDHGTINITAASEPGVTALLESFQWTDMASYMFKATIKNTASAEKYFDVYAYLYNGAVLENLNILGSPTLGAGQSGSVENQLLPYSGGLHEIKIKIVTYEPGSWVVNGLKTFSAGTVTF